MGDAIVTSYAVIHFKLVFACGSRVLPRFVLRFCSASEKTKNDGKKKYRSAEGYDHIRYTSAFLV
jgi:hypothetical protein